MKYKKGDWVRLRNFPSQGPFEIESVSNNNTCYHIDFGDGLEPTYEIEILLDKGMYRDKVLKDILDV